MFKPTGQKRIFIDILVFWFIVEIILAKQMFSNGFPAGTDCLGHMAQMAYLANEGRWLYIWREFGLGFPENIRGLDFILIPMYLVIKDPALTIKIFTFLMFWLAGVNMYIYVYNHTKSKNASLLAGIIYILNHWLYIQFTEGHIIIMFSYAFFPLLFLLLDKTFEKATKVRLILLAFFLTIVATFFHPQITYIFIFFLPLYITIQLLASLTSRKKEINKNFLKIIAFSLPLTAILSSFFLLPQLYGAISPYFTPYYKWPIEASLLIISYFKDKIGFNQTLLILIPLIGITLSFKRSKLTIFFVISACISAFLTIAPLPPFENIFSWVYTHIPYFQMLRSTKRWFIITIFTLALLLGINLAKIEEKILKKLKGFHIPVKWKIYLIISILLVGASIVNSFSACLTYTKSTQTLTPQQDLMELASWIKKIPGDFRLIQSSYIGYGDCSAYGPLGIGYHDLIYDSHFIHDKIVFQNGGWLPIARNFYLYTKNLGEWKQDKTMFKLLGAFNIKYAILPNYTPNKWLNIFLNQEGANIALNYSGNIVLENKYWLPHIYTTPEYLLVLGGKETMTSLLHFPNFTLNKCCLIYVNQNLNSLANLLNGSNIFIFGNSELVDLTMLRIANKYDEYTIKLGEYGFPSFNNTKYWINSWFGINNGKLTLSNSLITTRGKNTLELSYYADKTGWYEIWLRLVTHKNRGKLSITIDGKYFSTLHPVGGPQYEFKWISGGLIHLKKGQHTITISNDGTESNDLDVLMIVPTTIIESEFKQTLKMIRDFHGKIMVVWEAENLLGKEKNNNYPIVHCPYNASNGFAVKILGRQNIAQEGIATASSIQFCQDLGLLQPQYAIDGKMNTRWASEFNVMPQWLEISWTEPRQLVGIKITFEHAYAESYKIQTWSNGKWVDQISVKNNTKLVREHVFPQPVKTKKLRLYFTHAPAYNSVSIWELEIYTKERILTKIEIPRKGAYQLHLRILPQAKETTITAKIGENILKKICNKTCENFQWVTFKPVNLTMGKQTLTLDFLSKGSILIDEIVLISTNNIQENSLHNLFKQNKNFQVSYKQINPCKYAVYVNNSKTPLILVFSEAYHPLWRAQTQKAEYQPLIANSAINCFIIPEKENQKIIIKFIGQKYANLGLIISSISLVFTIIFIFLDKLRNIYWKNFGKQ